MIYMLLFLILERVAYNSPIDDKWYRFNVTFVNPITNLQKEVIDFGTHIYNFTKNYKI